MENNSEVYKGKVSKLKTDIQNTYYYHNNRDIMKEEKIDSIEKKEISKYDLLRKIDSIFKRNDYVYQASINIMYKNGKNIEEKIVGRKDKYLLTMNGEKINIDDIYDIN